MWQLTTSGLTLLALLAAPGDKPGAFKTGPGDWPQWRGPERTAVSTETGLLKTWPGQGPPLAWRAQGIGNGYGSVAIADGRLYVVGHIGKDQSVFCLNTADGQQIWKSVIRSPGDGSRSTPTIDGERLYVLASRGNQEADIVCLATADGKELWRRNFQKDFKGKMMSSWGYSESPLVDGDRVLCTPGGAEATLVALDKKTGETIWQSQVPGGDAAGYASIIVSEGAGVKQYLTILEKGLVSVRASDGKFLWRYNRMANGTANIPTPIARDDLVFCSTGYGAGAALLRLVPDGAGGVKAEEVKFLKGNEFQNHHGGMVLVGDYIYAGHSHNNGYPICLEFNTGKVVWRHDERGEGTGSAAVVYADGHLYFRYQNAVMALIEATPNGFNLKSTFRIPKGGDPSWPHPVVAGGKLYLRDQNQLFCYDVKAQ
jgi:outer membrane protein assembly factor BamB